MLSWLLDIETVIKYKENYQLLGMLTMLTDIKMLSDLKDLTCWYIPGALRCDRATTLQSFRSNILYYLYSDVPVTESSAAEQRDATQILSETPQR